MKHSRNLTGGPRRRTIILPLLVVLAVAACGSRDVGPSSSTAASTSTATLTAPASEPNAAAASATDQPGQSGAPARIGSRTFVNSIVDTLRVRSLPLIAPESRQLEPPLPRGTILYVVDGPVAASGYSWFQVIPLTTRPLPNGWIAAAARDGERWIEPTDFRCPSIPTDFRMLSHLPPGIGLACFGRVPITVRARVVACRCEVDGPVVSPDWFSSTGGSGDLLVDVGQTRPPANPRDWFFLHLAPDAELNADLTLSAIVEITGVFDHPAATTCTLTTDGQSEASLECRLSFAVTKLTTVRT
jgi:hypothetical protein